VGRIKTLGVEAAKAKFLKLDRQISRLQILALEFAQISIWPSAEPFDKELRTEVLDTATRAIHTIGDHLIELAHRVSPKVPYNLKDAHDIISGGIERMNGALTAIEFITNGTGGMSDAERLRMVNDYARKALRCDEQPDKEKQLELPL
jgi:hypothetical protein